MKKSRFSEEQGESKADAPDLSGRRVERAAHTSPKTGESSSRRAAASEREAKRHGIPSSQRSSFWGGLSTT
jgi:hypothetical protein